MKISDWLDEREAENVDVSQIVLPADMSYDEVPEGTIFQKLIMPSMSGLPGRRMNSRGSRLIFPHCDADHNCIAAKDVQ